MRLVQYGKWRAIECGCEGSWIAHLGGYFNYISDKVCADCGQDFPEDLLRQREFLNGMLRL
jgi:hypothetical protein